MSEQVIRGVREAREAGLGTSLLPGRSEMESEVALARGMLVRLREWRRLQGIADELEALTEAAESSFNPTEAEQEEARVAVQQELDGLIRGAVPALEGVPRSSPAHALHIDSRGIVLGVDGALPNLTQPLTSRQLASTQLQLDSATEPIQLLDLVSDISSVNSELATDAQIVANRNRAEMARDALLGLFSDTGPVLQSVQLVEILNSPRVERVQSFLRLTHTSIVEMIQQDIEAAHAR